MMKKEFIAKYYFMVGVELAEPIYSSELFRILECDMTVLEFEKWLDDMSNQGIESYDERAKFNIWLDENNLKHIWDEKKSK